MNPTRTARPAHAVLALLLVAGCAGGPAWPPAGGPARDPDAWRTFEAMLVAVDAAQLELQNGRPEPFKALWSRADDVTLSGGLGGRIERGWASVSRRLDWVGTQFSRGTHTHERVAADVSGDLAYVVQSERLRYHVPGEEEGSTREYRVTMVFRREGGAWRIVHRQADSNLTPPPAR